MSYHTISELEKLFDTKILPDTEVLYSEYDRHCSGGCFFGLIQRNGILYEINGSHCSYYWLEDQWNEEEVTVDELLYRSKNGTNHMLKDPGLLRILNDLKNEKTFYFMTTLPYGKDVGDYSPES